LAPFLDFWGAMGMDLEITWMEKVWKLIFDLQGLMSKCHKFTLLPYLLLLHYSSFRKLQGIVFDNTKKNRTKINHDTRQYFFLNLHFCFPGI